MLLSNLSLLFALCIVSNTAINTKSVKLHQVVVPPALIEMTTCGTESQHTGGPHAPQLKQSAARETAVNGKAGEGP